MYYNNLLFTPFPLTPPSSLPFPEHSLFLAYYSSPSLHSLIHSISPSTYFLHHLTPSYPPLSPPFSLTSLLHYTSSLILSSPSLPHSSFYFFITITYFLLPLTSSYPLPYLYTPFLTHFSNSLVHFLTRSLFSLLVHYNNFLITPLGTPFPPPFL